MAKSLWATKVLVSSANSFGIDSETGTFISLTYILNNKGPNTDPWDTPVVNSAVCEYKGFLHVVRDLLQR